MTSAAVTPAASEVRTRPPTASPTPANPAAASPSTPIPRTGDPTSLACDATPIPMHTATTSVVIPIAAITPPILVTGPPAEERRAGQPKDEGPEAEERQLKDAGRLGQIDAGIDRVDDRDDLRQ